MQGEVKTESCGHSYFCGCPYCICICRSLPFRSTIYGRRVFKWIMQGDLLRFALVNVILLSLCNMSLDKLFLIYPGTTFK